MIDTFSDLHPKARGRFTCWNQYQNGRATQESGGRLDYIYCDSELYNHLSTPVAGLLDCGLGKEKNKQWKEQQQYEIKSAKAAGIGSWLAAPTGGGGIPDGKPNDYAWHSKIPPHSGIIYTPPQWSDHIGASLLLHNIKIKNHQIQITKTQKSETRKCQPHASVRSITSFFGKKSTSSSSSSSSNSNNSSESIKPPQKKQKKGMFKFFGKKK